LTPTPIAQYALDHSLKLVRTGQFNSESLPPADLMIVIAFGQKISPGAVAHPRLGSFNLHASLLPRFRGAAPINWAILRGESQTGNSVIRLAQKMDAGPILGQSTRMIRELETAGELHDLLARDGVALVERVIEDLERGRAGERIQNESQATLAPKLTRQMSQIDWTRPAIETARKIRGLHPWPGCRVRLLDAAGGECAHLTLVRARPAVGEGPRWMPGEIMIHGEVSAGEEAVEIVDVQPEGRRAMSLAEYRRGHRWTAGMKLESIP
jgi:methionyl-tRNA formyltransferase